MTLFLALLPLILVIGALLARRSTLHSALLGLVAALGVAVLHFGFDASAAGAALSQWWELVLEVMLIIFGGIAFAEAGRRSGDQAEISTWLRSHLGTGVAPVLAVVHGVTPLAESLTGFGVGVAVAVPLLLGLGYAGNRAAPLGLLGLCAVPWGAMGPGTLIAARLSGVDFDEFGVLNALISLPVFLGVGIAAVLLISTPGRRLPAIAAALASALLLWVSVTGANQLLGTATAGALGAALTLMVHLLLRGRIRLSPRLRQALLPYAVLLGGVLVARTLLTATELADTAWHWLGSPALWLAVSTVLALRPHPRQLRLSLRHAGRTWIHVGPATGLFIVVGVVMAVSGMSDEIASALAGLGAGYLFLVPVIGGAGGFVTGSNSGANAMFAGPQAQAAQALGAAPGPVGAMQNVSASLLTMAAPSRVEMAVRLCPDQPERQPVLRQILGTTTAITVVLMLISGLASAPGLAP